LETCYIYGGYQDLNSSLLQNLSISSPNPDSSKPSCSSTDHPLTNVSSSETAFYTINVSQPWNKKGDQWQYSTLFPSNATEFPPEGISGGALLGDHSSSRRIHQYGGAQPSPADNSTLQVLKSRSTDELWAFDLSSQVWTKTTSEVEHSPDFKFSQYGAYVEPTDRDFATHFDIPGMTIVNTSSMGHRHAATNCSRNGRVRIGGQVQYISEAGSAGVLVVFGGTWIDPNQTDIRVFNDLVMTSPD
jgi:hypothetical protein